MLTEIDITNLRKLLNRVTVQGVQEAMVLAVLDQKLAAMSNEESDGQDATPTSE